MDGWGGLVIFCLVNGHGDGGKMDGLGVSIGVCRFLFCQSYNLKLL